MSLSARRLKTRGQVYIGLIISMGILVILSQTIISLVIASYDLLNFASARTTAKAIAQETIELVRNLPYSSIGTQGGIPAGSLPQTELVNRNGLNYIVTTSVIYIDDPFDNQAPTDLLATDYKRVRIDVSWEGLAASKTNPVTLITDISPKGIETSVGGGTLSILVFDASGKAVPQASVHIVATSKGVDLTIQTGSDGRIMLPGAPKCNSCYSITVTKSGYSTDRTYTSSEVANPTKPEQSVITDTVTNVSFAIDLLGTLNVSSKGSVDNNFPAIGNQSFRLRGNKIIGTTNQDVPVYKYDKTLTTDASGNLQINGMEWDSYQFTNLSSSYDVAGTNPLVPLNLLPNSTLNFSYSLQPNSSNSLLTIFTDPANSPLASVSARLTKQPNFEATSSSGLSTDPNFGQIFFSNLTNAAYVLEASVSGFINYSGTVNVNQDTTAKIIMQPQ
jgi:hypothetical protein